MSGSTPTNTSAVDFEKQQAAAADAKEAARQASLQQGQTLIDQIFNGSPVMGPQTYDWSTFKPPDAGTSYFANLAQAQGQNIQPPSATGVPEGYTAVQLPAREAHDATPATMFGNVPIAAQPAQGATTAGWGLQDANGRVYYPGDPLTYQGPTGQTTGGFDDAFYKNYNQKVLDYYQPDEQRQYDEAQRNLTYNLARAGTLQSSVAGDKQGELAYNDALQKANIVANANAQTGQMQNQIQANKESLINQLYATDDPTLTANLAESSAQASRMQDPTLTPAAALFSPALTAAGSVANYALSPYSTVQPGASSAPMSPAPASSSASSGVLKSGWG